MATRSALVYFHSSEDRKKIVGRQMAKAFAISVTRGRSRSSHQSAAWLPHQETLFLILIRALTPYLPYTKKISVFKFNKQTGTINSLELRVILVTLSFEFWSRNICRPLALNIFSGQGQAYNLFIKCCRGFGGFESIQIKTNTK